MNSLKTFLKKFKLIVILNDFSKDLIDKYYSITLCFLIFIFPKYVSKILAEK